MNNHANQPPAGPVFGYSTYACLEAAMGRRDLRWRSRGGQVATFSAAQKLQPPLLTPSY